MDTFFIRFVGGVRDAGRDNRHHLCIFFNYTSTLAVFSAFAFAGSLVTENGPD